MPDALVGSEMRARLEDMVTACSTRASRLEQYLQITGATPRRSAPSCARRRCRRPRSTSRLRAIAVAEGLDASDDELDEEIEQPVGERRRRRSTTLASSSRAAASCRPVRSDLTNRNALEWLTDHVTVVDDAGNPIGASCSRSPRTTDDTTTIMTDHDHDHDH